MKHTYVTQRDPGAVSCWGHLVSLSDARRGGGPDEPRRNWTFSVNGNINVDYIYSDCQEKIR